MFEHAPQSLLDERWMGTEWLEWWNGLEDGITRSSRQPVLAVTPRNPGTRENPIQVPTRREEGVQPSMGAFSV